MIEDENIIYQLTSSYNQNNNIYNNISNIILGSCETKLKLYNNISENSSLLILKMDIYEKGLLIPTIEYEVFNIETKEPLDLNLCKDIKIKLNIPVNIDEKNLFKYNSSNEYYNDICYSYTTTNNTDIIIKDRRNEYIDQNLSLCENNCDYNTYNNNTKKVLCECNIKIKIPLISEIIINKDKLLNNFIDIKNIININIMKCYYTLFKKQGLIKNLGNYIISIIILIEIFLCIIFKVKGYYNLKNKIDLMIDNKINNKIQKNYNYLKENINENKEKKINNNKIIIKKKKKKKLKINRMKTNGEINNKSNSRLEFKNTDKLIDKKKTIILII